MRMKVMKWLVKNEVRMKMNQAVAGEMNQEVDYKEKLILINIEI